MPAHRKYVDSVSAGARLRLLWWDRAGGQAEETLQCRDPTQTAHGTRASWRTHSAHSTKKSRSEGIEPDRRNNGTEIIEITVVMFAKLVLIIAILVSIIATTVLMQIHRLRVVRKHHIMQTCLPIASHSDAYGVLRSTTDWRN
jgi:hypothetical protein